MEGMTDLERLADLIHGELCTRHHPCGYGRSGFPHDTYYRDRARSLLDRLGPSITAAGVLLAVKAVLEELM